MTDFQVAQSMELLNFSAAKCYSTESHRSDQYTMMTESVQTTKLRHVWLILLGKTVRCRPTDRHVSDMWSVVLCFRVYLDLLISSFASQHCCQYEYIGKGQIQKRNSSNASSSCLRVRLASTENRKRLMYLTSITSVILGYCFQRCQFVEHWTINWQLDIANVSTRSVKRHDERRLSLVRTLSDWQASLVSYRVWPRLDPAMIGYHTYNSLPNSFISRNKLLCYGAFCYLFIVTWEACLRPSQWQLVFCKFENNNLDVFKISEQRAFSRTKLSSAFRWRTTSCSCCSLAPSNNQSINHESISQWSIIAEMKCRELGQDALSQLDWYSSYDYNIIIY